MTSQNDNKNDKWLINLKNENYVSTISLFEHYSFYI